MTSTIVLEGDELAEAAYDLGGVHGELALARMQRAASKRGGFVPDHKATTLLERLKRSAVYGLFLAGVFVRVAGGLQVQASVPEDKFVQAKATLKQESEERKKRAQERAAAPGPHGPRHRLPGESEEAYQRRRKAWNQADKRERERAAATPAAAAPSTPSADRGLHESAPPDSTSPPPPVTDEPVTAPVTRPVTSTGDGPSVAGDLPRAKEEFFSSSSSSLPEENCSLEEEEKRKEEEKASGASAREAAPVTDAVTDPLAAMVAQVVVLWRSTLGKPDDALVTPKDREAARRRLAEPRPLAHFHAAFVYVASEEGSWFRGDNPERKVRDYLAVICGDRFDECVKKGLRKLAAQAPLSTPRPPPARPSDGPGLARPPAPPPPQEAPLPPPEERAAAARAALEAISSVTRPIPRPTVRRSGGGASGGGG
jgi:hypothetical protein